MNNYYYKNLYETLGIEPTDDIAKIKSAYRKLARKYHPDANGGDKFFVAKFKEITEAHEILTDAKKKSLYDSYKGYLFNKQTASSSTQSNPKNTSNAAKKDTATQKSSKQKASEPQSSFTETFNDIVDGLFNSKNKSKSNNTHTNRQSKQAKNGSDITTKVEITYQEALLGTHRTINILHTEICPNCGGKLFVNGAQCPLCKGAGETSIHKKINVKIPANIKQNGKIRISGEGNRGQHGGKNGDVYLVIKIQNDSDFTFDGLNANLELCILPFEAVLGTDKQIKTPQGSITMKIPSNTHQGQKFRLTSHGLKDAQGKIGDAIITVRIDIPKDLSDKEFELYKKLAEMHKN